MTERVTRRAALAGSVALPLAPAVAVAQAAVADPVARMGEEWQALSDQLARADDEGNERLFDAIFCARIALDNRMGGVIPTTPGGVAAQIRAAITDKEGCALELEDGREGELLRAALTGAERLAGVPAVAVGGKERQDATEARIEAQLAELRRRIDQESALPVDAPDDVLDSMAEWCEAPMRAIEGTTPTTLREFAAKIEAAVLASGDSTNRLGTGSIGETIARDAKRLLGRPPALHGDRESA